MLRAVIGDAGQEDFQKQQSAPQGDEWIGNWIGCIGTYRPLRACECECFASPSLSLE